MTTVASVTLKYVLQDSFLAVRPHFMIPRTCLPALEERQPRTCMAPTSGLHRQVMLFCPQETEEVLSEWTFLISKMNLIFLADTVRAVECLQRHGVLTFPD